MASPEAPIVSSTKRTPVNRRRAKVPPERRKRVPAACDSCNLRRIKCSGTHPCYACESYGRNCQYPSGRQKAQPETNEVLQLRAECTRLKQCLDAATSTGAGEHAPTQAGMTRTEPHLGPDLTEQSTRDGAQPSPDEGRLLQDLDGTARYLGASSGATFLDSLKEFIATLFPLAFADSRMGLYSPEATFVGSLGFYQTHDSRPLPSDSANIRSLPSMTEMFILLANLRYFAQDGNGDFSSGGIYYWTDFDQLLQSTKYVRMQELSEELPPRIGTLHAALAVASLVSSLTESGCKTSSHECLTNAKAALGNPLDSVDIADVEALGLLALYLLETNRRDSAHMHVSVAVHILLIHGVHKGWLVDEGGKRLFWTIYVLERRLSIMMGRPPILSDAAIQISLPEPTSSLPPVDGLRAHIGLSKISDYILCYVYEVAPETREPYDRVECINTALSLLSSWIADLPCCLQVSSNGEPQDRAVCELHMLYNQLIIITLRPVLFAAVRKAVAGKYIQSSLESEDHHHTPKVLECGAAAARNLDLAQRMSKMGHMHKLMHSGLHHLFNAAVVSLLHRIFPGAADDSDPGALAFAEYTLRQAAGPTDSYASDCLGVLLNLRSLVEKIQTQTVAPRRQTMRLAISETSARPPIETEPSAASTLPQAGTFDLHWEDFNAQFDELTDWLQGDDMQLYEM